MHFLADDLAVATCHGVSVYTHRESTRAGAHRWRYPHLSEGMIQDRYAASAGVALDRFSKAFSVMVRSGRKKKPLSLNDVVATAVTAALLDPTAADIHWPVVIDLVGLDAAAGLAVNGGKPEVDRLMTVLSEAERMPLLSHRELTIREAVIFRIAPTASASTPPAPAPQMA